MKERKDELEQQVTELQNQKLVLEQQIQELNLEKLNKMETLKNDLERQVEWLDKEKIKLTKERDNLIRKIRISNEKKWKNALKMIILLGLIDLVLVPLIIYLFGIPIYWFFIALGLITFMGMAIIVNYMSGTAPFNTGEVRKSFTISFIAVYFALMPLILFGGIKTAQSSITNIIQSFTVILALIISFYFATTAVEKYVHAKEKGKMGNQ